MKTILSDVNVVNQSGRQISRAALVYLTQEAENYCITTDFGYSVQRRPLLGLQYLTAILEQMNIKTALFDQAVFGFDLNWLIEELKKYDMVGFYCSDSQEAKVKRYCKNIKEKSDILILVGGPSTLLNNSFIEFGCDIVVHGEGEITIRDIIQYYNNGKKELSEIDGISYKKGNQIIKTQPQKPILNLDVLPFPDRSKIDINSYYDYFLFCFKKPYITMVASRGCLYRCAYCTSCKMWGYRYRRRSVDNVIEEIDDAVKRYNIKYIAFQDDIFGGTNEWIEEFCQKLLEKSYKVSWMAILHPFSIRKDMAGLLNLMKKAGCDTLSFGLQSVHPKILKNINRHPSEPEQLKKTLKVANQLGFVTAVSYIFGLPGDTKDTIQATVEYSLNCGSTLANYYTLSILRGSELETKYKNEKVCELSSDEILELTTQASRIFYTRPLALFKIISFIAKNPTWILQISTNLFSILARIGFVRTKIK